MSISRRRMLLLSLGSALTATGYAALRSHRTWPATRRGWALGADFSLDFSCNHIFDPQSGQSPQELASVSIVAPTGLQADALSTAAMVLGTEQTLSLVQGLPNVDAFLVLKSGEILQTRGFPTADVT